MEIRREFYLEKRIAHQKTQANGGNSREYFLLELPFTALPEKAALFLCPIYEEVRSI